MAAQPLPSRMELLASKRHMAGALLILLVIGIIGRILVSHPRGTTLAAFGNTGIYLFGLAFEWILFLYVWFGVRRRAKSIRQIIDESSWGMARFGLYMAIAGGAAVIWMAWGFLLGTVVNLEGPDELRWVQALLPHSTMQKALWIVLSLSAGFCEEFAYRGYLQQQFQRLTGSLYVAVLLQTAAVGIAHMALPWKVVLSAMSLHLLLGAMAAWSRSLVPGMLLHASFDVFAGLFSP